MLPRRNAKLADVFSCVALEDMDVAERSDIPLSSCTQSAGQADSAHSHPDKAKAGLLRAKPGGQVGEL